MIISFPRLAAVALLFLGGGVVGLAALGLLVARILIAIVVPVSTSPSDIALVGDLAQLVPFIGAFAIANLFAAAALIAGRSWADPVAMTLAASAVGIGLLGIVLLILGNDPFASVASDHALTGIEMIGAFAGLYAAVIVALALDGTAVVSAPRPAAA